MQYIFTSLSKCNTSSHNQTNSPYQLLGNYFWVWQELGLIIDCELKNSTLEEGSVRVGKRTTHKPQEVPDTSFTSHLSPKVTQAVSTAEGRENSSSRLATGMLCTELQHWSSGEWDITHAGVGFWWCDFHWMVHVPISNPTLIPL